MSSRTDSERGSVSAFVVCLGSALIFLALLIHDTGRAIDEYARISDVAGSAARIGAQSITGIRAGDPHLDPRLALNGAREFLRTNGVSGRVVIENGSVRVVVAADVQMSALRILGVQARHLTATRTARLVSG